MALFHMSAKIISRAKGESACAAAAYRSASLIMNEYDGQVHDYRRKQSVTRSEVLLPDNAPGQYADRTILWNAVEAAEKQINAQLAREIEFALPREFDEQTRERIALEFIQTTFVKDGMIADVNFHNPPQKDSRGRPIDSYGNITKEPNKFIYNNPHVHVLLTLRPIDELGQWENKKQKLYVCEKDGRQKSFSADELKDNPGWEKLYSYKDETGKKNWHTKTYAEKHPELTLINRYPKSEYILNPKVKKWNSPETLKQWRAAWAEKANRSYEEMGLSEKIDHRSYKDQGVDLIPTVHMGKMAMTEEKRLRESGGHTELYELNQAITEHNKEVMLLTELRRLKERMEQLLLQTRERITLAARSLAEKLERLRAAMIITLTRKKNIQEVKDETEERIRMTKFYLMPLNNTKNKKENNEHHMVAQEEIRYCSIAAAAEIEKLKELSIQADKRISALNERYLRSYKEYKECDTKDEGIIQERIQIRPEIEEEYSIHPNETEQLDIELGCRYGAQLKVLGSCWGMNL